MRAAVLVLLSVIIRFYPALARLKAAAIGAGVLAFTVSASAQQTAERPPLGSILTAEPLGLLPASDNLFSLLDTVVPDVIADRIDTGGLSAGEAARVGAHGSTWTQTLFTLGDIDITDPSGSGTPLLVPGVEMWERVDVATGIMPVERSAPGLAVTMSPRSAGASWLRHVDLVGSPAALNADGNVGNAPSIARLNTWLHADITAAGPISRTVGLFATVAATRSTHFERSDPSVIDSNLATAFATLTAAPRADDRLRTIGWLQRSRDPIAGHRLLNQANAGERAVAWHAQSAWHHLTNGGSTSSRVFGGYTRRTRTNDLVERPFVIAERLSGGPIPTALAAGPGTDATWSAGLRLTTAPAAASEGRHAFIAGIDGGGGSMTLTSSFSGRIGELINGVPARLWEFSPQPVESSWRSTSVSAYAGDTFAIASRVTVNGALRVEHIRGTRGGGSPAVSWTNLLPRAGVHWSMLKFWDLASFGQYSRYGHRLPLAHLAYGDPTGPYGNVYRWSAPVGSTTIVPSTIGALVQRVGPGTGGDPQFTSIDPSLRRPHMDEAILGFEARPHPSSFVRLVAIGRRERDMIGVVNTTVPESSYSKIFVPDMGVDVVHDDDDQMLAFYNRSPATFGKDRYLLTNPADDETSFVGADLTGQIQTARVFFLMGITAGRSEGLSANRGFGPLENDAAVLGEVYTNPNARDHAQGRVFTERGYTIKFAGTYHFPHGIDAGLIGRYQDGQHFARLVVMDGLNQGMEAVRAFRNGRTRFTFSMTVDGRMQKRFALGGKTMTLLVDAYNMFNQALEIEEFSVSGDMSRLKTAVQPPRVIQIGLRIPF
jgi:hypothetical protein